VAANTGKMEMAGGAVRPAAIAGRFRAGEPGNLFPELPTRSLQCASRKWFSRLCVLMNPILPGAIHRDHAGEMFENTSLAVPRDPPITPEPRKSQTL
jgi:hypothetical protein